MNPRLKEIDFLRGIAIMLVIFRHQPLFDFMTRMGWIGVDLFFVLSGFLVSGLLFKEYLRYGNIDSKNFLIRRGFKIYPIYYLVYPLYLLMIPLFSDLAISKRGVVSELFFFQNYTQWFGYAFIPGWSLAVEEHFYIVLSALLWLAFKYKFIGQAEKTMFARVEVSIICIMILCLSLRIYRNTYHLDQFGPNFTMTHLRLDSLLSGVYVSYMYHFKKGVLTRNFNKFKNYFLPVAVIGLAWSPFIEPNGSFFVMTTGFTLLFCSFSLVLIYFIMSKGMTGKLDAVLSVPVVNAVSEIGKASYSIYIIHALFVGLYFNLKGWLPGDHKYLGFILVFCLSIGTGILMTKYLEKYFLNLRDKHYPSRVQKLKQT